MTIDLDHFNSVLNERFTHYYNAAVTTTFNPELPQTPDALPAYLKAYNKRKRGANAYFNTLTDPDERAMFRYKIRNEDILIGMRTLYDGFGPQHPHVTQLFFNSYGSMALSMMVNNQTRNLYANTPDLKDKLPEMRPELSDFQEKLDANHQPYHVLNALYRNLREISERAPLLTVHHPSLAYDSSLPLNLPHLMTSLNQMPRRAMIQDFEQDDISLQLISFKLTV